MTANESAPRLFFFFLLSGLDGSNPLGFLAAIGTAVVLQDVFPEMRLGWEQTEGGWRPSLAGCGDDEQEFVKKLSAALKDASMTVFDVDNKMPFDTAKFSRKLRDVQGLLVHCRSSRCRFSVQFWNRTISR